MIWKRIFHKHLNAFLGNGDLEKAGRKNHDGHHYAMVMTMTMVMVMAMAMVMVMVTFYIECDGAIDSLLKSARIPFRTNPIPKSLRLLSQGIFATRTKEGGFTTVVDVLQLLQPKHHHHHHHHYHHHHHHPSPCRYLVLRSCFSRLWYAMV